MSARTLSDELDQAAHGRGQGRDSTKEVTTSSSEGVSERTAPAAISGEVDNRGGLDTAQALAFALQTSTVISLAPTETPERHLVVDRDNGETALRDGNEARGNGEATRRPATSRPRQAR